MGETLLEFLEANGLLHYGAHIPGRVIRDFLGIDIPEIGTKETFDRLALMELDEVQKVRDACLRKGMYFKASGSDYRILLPSENLGQIKSYEDSSVKKMKRAVLLAKTTRMESIDIDQLLARMQVRAASESRKFGRV